ncbi:hypothetical protein LWI28_017220 [Acer negundo]|uniref:non-specific serine/threonine protein kinase n=1 Tax=Acer negundo TaxID=4023 RepID=A0AAD5IER7_ACENE|nr:hypothetical protein LWI28_017220 [Acer negundo]
MNSHLFSSSPFLSLVCFLLVVFAKIQSSSSNPYNMYESCKIQFQCGNITAGYPFWGGTQRPWGCGHPELKLNCEHNGVGDVPTMMINEVNYMVLDIKLEDQTLMIARMDYLKPEGICSPVSHNTTINHEIFDYSDGYENVTLLYDCPSNDNQAPPLPYKHCSYKNWSVKAGDHDSGICDASVFFPVPKNLLPREGAGPSDFRQVLGKGFELKWKLGTCALDFNNEKICFCPNQQHGLYHACPACYPFWGEPRPQPCAAHQELKLNCNEDDDLTAMEINGVYYWFLDINPNARTPRIARKDYQNGICSPEFPNTTINPEIFDYSDGKLNWKTMDNPSDMGKFLKEGFVLKWKFGGVPCVDCTKREGSCGPDHSGSNGTIGVCPPSSSLPDQAPKESPSSALHDQASTGSPDSTGTQP